MESQRRKLFPLWLGLLPVLVFADSLALLFGITLASGPYAALWVALTGLAAATAIPHGRRAVLAGALAFALTGALLFAAPWGAAKRFYRAVGRLERGMTRAEVAAVLPGCAGQSDEILLRSSGDTEHWYSEPWFAVCDVVYDADDRLAQAPTFAYDPPWGDWPGAAVEASTPSAGERSRWGRRAGRG